MLVVLARVFSRIRCRAQGRGSGLGTTGIHTSCKHCKSNIQHPCQLLGGGGYQERKPGGVVQKLGVLTPLEGVQNSLLLATYW